MLKNIEFVTAVPENRLEDFTSMIEWSITMFQRVSAQFHKRKIDAA